MGGRALGTLCLRKLFCIGHCRDGFGGTGKEHEDTGDPEQRGMKGKPRRKQRASLPAT